MSRKSAAKTRKRSLRGQKLVAHQKRKKRAFLATTILISAATIFYFYTPYSPAVKTSRKTVSWDVVVAPSLVTQKSSEIKPRVIEEVRTALKYGYDTSRLPRLLNKLAVISKSDNVYLFRSGITQVTIFGSVATPLFELSGSPQWGVSKEGHLYRFDELPKDLPYLAGVYSGESITTDETKVGRHQGSLVEKRLVSQAIELTSALKLANIAFDGITHLDYRGFEVKLAHQDSRIIVGYSPFSTKSMRLREVLSKLSQKNRIARRIEMDFEGKIFIKE